MVGENSTEAEKKKIKGTSVRVPRSFQTCSLRLAPRVRALGVREMNRKENEGSDWVRSGSRETYGKVKCNRSEAIPKTASLASLLNVF